MYHYRITLNQLGIRIKFLGKCLGKCAEWEDVAYLSEKSRELIEKTISQKIVKEKTVVLIDNCVLEPGQLSPDHGKVIEINEKPLLIPRKNHPPIIAWCSQNRVRLSVSTALRS